MEQSNNITAVYCRTASPDPAAIEMQRETLLRYAEAHGFGNVEVFEDDGFGGNDPTRPAFARMNALITEGRVTRVLARSIARLGRNIAEVLAWARIAQEQDVKVITLDMGAAALPPVSELADDDFAPDMEAGPLHKRFAAWLAGPEGGAFAYQVGDSHYTILRARKNADFDYLYCQGDYKTNSVKRRNTFEYAGIFCRRDSFVYDDQANIRALRHENLMRLGAAGMLERLEAEVRGAVELAIGGNRKKLKIGKLTTEQKLRELEYYQQYGAASEARAAFLGSERGRVFSFACYYEPERWTEESLLEYILDPVGYTAREAAAYMESHQETMLYEFLTNDALKAEYRALAGNSRHPAHRIKGIMEAVNATEAKTVRVTIRKDGTEFTFKANADDLRRDCGNHYITWYIAGADRREFERLFGRSADYGPEHILRIEYGRTVLYEAEVEAE